MTDQELEAKEELKLNDWYDKIEANIKSSKTFLHLTVCIAMYSQFILYFPNNEEEAEYLLGLMEAKEVEINLLIK